MVSPETNPLPGPLTTCLLAQAFLFYRKWESNLCAAFCLGACIIFSLITIARLIAAKHVFIARPNLEPIALRFSLARALSPCHFLLPPSFPFCFQCFFMAHSPLHLSFPFSFFLRVPTLPLSFSSLVCSVLPLDCDGF